MAFENVLSYKLLPDGTLEKLNNQELMEHFKSVNVLAFYINRTKRLYIWIGQNANKTLKKYIPEAEKAILQMNEGITILRHFTVEQSQESSEFFESINLDEEEYKVQLKKWKDYQLSVYSEINEKDVEANNAFMIGKFDDAIKHANEVIELAKKIKNEEIIQQKHKFIEDINNRKEILKQKVATKKEIETLNDELSAAIDAKKIELSREIAQKIKTKFETILESKPTGKSKELLEEEDQQYKNWQDKQEKLRIKELEIKQEIEDLKVSIEDGFKERNIEEIDKLILELQKIAEKSTKDDVKQETLTYADEKSVLVKKIQHEIEISENIAISLEKGNKEADQKNFNESLEIIENALKIAKENNIEEKISIVEDLKKSINQKKDKYDREIALISKLEKQIETNLKKENYKIAIPNCEKLIQVAERNDIKEKSEKYAKLLPDLKNKFEIQQKQLETEHQELLKKAKEVENLIDVEKNVLPIVDEFEISDLIGDLSENVDEMVNQLSEILGDHRVEVKSEITSSSILRTASGEVLEIEKQTKVEEISKADEGEVKSLKFSVESTLDNPFDDIIEEAIIQDIIPYNFEITEIQLNGEIPENEPEQILTKDGVELKWTVNDIQPKESVSINYDLRKRISRTIIFPMKEQLKIVKTHSNLIPMDTQGLYNAELNFANNFNTEIQGVVIEDIVPQLYIYEIKAPEDLPDSKEEQSVGSLVKWTVNNVPVNYSNLYHYQLIEIYRFEDLKIMVNKIIEEAQNSLEKGHIGESIDKFNKIQKKLIEFK